MIAGILSAGANAITVVGIAFALSAWAALAHEGQTHGDTDQVPANLDMVETEFGHTGDPDEVTRTIDVVASDDMRFAPDHIHVTAGETVRISVMNTGETLHELVIGRAEDLAHHAELMLRFPYMEHAEPYMTHVDVGQTGQIVWTFTETGRFEFGCLIPGHFDAGMRGELTVSN